MKLEPHLAFEIYGCYRNPIRRKVGRKLIGCRGRHLAKAVREVVGQPLWPEYMGGSHAILKKVRLTSVFLLKRIFHRTFCLKSISYLSTPCCSLVREGLPQWVEPTTMPTMEGILPRDGSCPHDVAHRAMSYATMVFPCGDFPVPFEGGHFMHYFLYSRGSILTIIGHSPPRALSMGFH